ncbi:MAG: TonB-dependent receptor [Candidatus Aminicenantes bacterium]|nr:TonB-dependent receptor [Candidatus Aminicenantes bacterium]
MSRKFKIFFAAALIFSVASLALAQRVMQTGVLNGTVTDDQGMPLPGVRITATSPAMMLPETSKVTDEKGFFRFPQLPAGVYTVTFELEAFKTLIREQILVSMGMTTPLRITLEPTEIEESITVVGMSPTVDTAKTSLGVSLGLDFLRNIPAATRSFGTIFNMAPGITGDTTHGSSVRDNAYAVDGVNITDPVTGTPFTRTGFEVAEEYMVQTTGHTAEYGSVRGAVLNIVTKSGGNSISGEANIYYRSKDLQWDNTEGTPFEGEFVGFNYEYDGTAQIGGPIMKDKLWFFVNYSHRYRETFVEGYPYDEDDHQPYDRKYITPYAKLSWQINPAMKFVGSWNYSPFWRNHRGASKTRTVDTTWKQFSRAHGFNLNYSYMISDNLIFTAKGAAVLFDFDLMKKNDIPRYWDRSARVYSGSYGYDDLYRRYRYQFLTDATYFIDDFYGRHEWKAGFEFEHAWDTRERIHNRDPRNGLGPFFTNRSGGADGVPYYVWDYEDFKRHDQKFVYSLYLQDRWNPTDRLTINAGFRFDRQEGRIPEQGEGREAVTVQGITYDPVVTSAFKPIAWNTISPRLGLSYDITGDGKTVIKASYGRFYIANILQWFVTVNPNSYINRLYYLNSDWSIDYFRRISATGGTVMDDDLRSPYLDEIVIGIQREIIPDLSLSVNYIRKWDRWLMEDVSEQALDLAAIKDGNFNWSFYTPVQAVDDYDGSTVTFYDLDPDLIAETYTVTNPEPAQRDYDGFEIVLNKRFSNNWQMLASYVYANSRGLIGTDFNDSWTGTSYFDNPNAHTNAEGRFPYERRHQFKVQGTVRLPYGFLVSTYYRSLAGRRYTREIRSNDLGLDLEQGTVTINAEERGARGLPWLHQWDLRVEKQFNIKDRFRIGLIADCFNVLNLNTATSVETISSSTAYVFEEVDGILDPRILRFGLRIMW